MSDCVQVQAHMCYSDFAEIIEHIVALDVDVLLMESFRSGMEVLDAFKAVGYAGGFGAGVWDVHSPRIPARDEIVALVENMLAFFEPSQLWLTPDCGLKTRGLGEVVPSLENIVAAALELRGKYGG